MRIEKHKDVSQDLEKSGKKCKKQKRVKNEVVAVNNLIEAIQRIRTRMS